jgi:glycerol-3-phosphate dehydrogenase (NAD(P)+)
MTSRISILGAGSWGTALAILATRNGYQTLLWGHNPKHLRLLDQQRENTRYLPGYHFSDLLTVTDNLFEAATFSEIIIISVPSHAFNDTLLKIRPFLSAKTKIAWATKGLNPEDGSLLHHTFDNIFSNKIDSAVLSGPTFAKEVAADLPTAITIASRQIDFAEQLANILHNPHFRTYTCTDIIGVQVGGAVKNVLAIAAGIADGLGFGANTRSAVITRGIAEVMRLGIALGGQRETFMGLAGIGDIILTCTDDQSRNRRFGFALGKNIDRAQIITEIGQEIEGISAAKEAYFLANKFAIDTPIIEQTYKVLYENLDPRTAVQNLLKREQKAESLSHKNG